MRIYFDVFHIHYIIMAPTSKKLMGHIGFGLSVHLGRRASVRPCVRLKHVCHILWTVHVRVLIFHMDSSWKNNWHTFFFLTELSPFLELCPFEKIRMKSDACHILWTVHARVLKFYILIPHGKIADSYFFSCLSYLPFWSYDPLKKIRIKSCQQDISKSIWARGLET